MLKLKKTTAAFLIGAALLGGSLSATLPAHAAGTCPPHDFTNKSYVGTRYEPDSHTYVFGIHANGDVEIKTCHFSHMWIRFRYTCKYCPQETERYTEDYYGETGHDCGPTKELP